MYQKILVPLDGSERAERVLPHAKALAQRMNAKVVLLQIVNPRLELPGEMGASVALHNTELERRTTEAREYLKNLEHGLASEGLEVKIRLSYGPVVETIVAVAAEERVDLIAMASHGRGGLSRVFYGSTASGVLQRVDRPLLVVRARRDE